MSGSRRSWPGGIRKPRRRSRDVILRRFGPNDGASAMGYSMINQHVELTAANGQSEAGLRLYSEMRLSVERCAAIDEAADLRNKAQKLEYYARIREDKATEVRFAEIRLRAITRIGELSRDLEKGSGRPSKTIPDTDVRNLTKAETLSDVGINERTARRYEELAGPKEEQAEKAVEAAQDLYYARQREAKEPPTMKGLLSSVDEALEATFGPRPKIKKKSSEPKPDSRFVMFIGSVQDISERYGTDPEWLAEDQPKQLASEHIRMCHHVISLLQQFIKHTEKRYPDVHQSSPRKLTVS